MSKSPKVVQSWRGTHRNELVAETIGEYLEKLGLWGVHSGLVDTVARPGQREPNINSAFPGDPNSPDPKKRRAYEVVEINKPFRVVIDWHGTLPGGVDYAWVNGEVMSPEVQPLVLGFLALVGIHIVVDCRIANNMLRYSPNGFMAEISPNGERAEPSYWKTPLTRLVANDLPPAQPEDFFWLRYAGDVTQAQRYAHNLPDHVPRFVRHIPNSEALAAELGFPDRQLHSVAWGCQEGDYFGEVGYKINPSEAFTR